VLRVKPLLVLANFTPDFEVRVTLDGKVLGSAKISHLICILQALRPENLQAVTYIIHCVFGFSVEDLIAVQSALQPHKSLFWLHDFSSVCGGFNLLRNDIVFCGAPEPTSLGCRVCIFGENRLRHVSRLRQLFEHGHFQVVAPSQSTLDIWRDAGAYMNEGTIVHPHWKFVKTTRRKRILKKNKKISIGFLGYPSVSKGWPVFLELVDRFQNDERYTFLHLAARNTSTASELTFVVTEVTDQDRSAPIRIMRESGLDFLAILSQWPETFSFAAYEAIAAGVSLLCFKESGNVAAQAKQTGCGAVFSDKDELIEFFQSGTASIARRTMYEKANGMSFNDTGTSASIIN
jgi:hypothetical protein